MQVNDQISKYQAEYYTESAHDAFVNVQRLLNDYTAKINCIEDAIINEKVYRKNTKKQRMKKPGAVFLLILGLIHVLLTLVLFAFTGYIGYTYYTNGNLHELITKYLPYDTLYLAIGGLVAYLIVLIITCKIFARRRCVGARLNIKKAKKTLKKKIKIAEKLTAVLTSYPNIYEGIHRVLIRTKRHPLGKLIIIQEDKIAIDNVKAFCCTSEEATKLYNKKEN